MRFWDTSAVVPLLVGQETSAHALDLLGSDQDIVVWWGTVVESWSALARLRRNRFIDAATESEAATQLEALTAAWHEVTPSRAVRKHSHRLLRSYELRAADALQLAAALVWAGDAAGSEFVTFDARLTEAARMEGFSLV